MLSTEDHIFPVVTTFVDEVIDETIGRSSKRWGLLLFALATGAAITFWLVRRRGGLVDPSMLPPEVEPT